MITARNRILEKLKTQSKSQIATVSLDSQYSKDDLFHPADKESTESGPLELFIQNAELANAEVTVIAEIEKLPKAIEDYLFSCKLPFAIQLSDHQLAPYFKESNISIDYGQCTFEHTISLISVFAGIAETGTVVSLSSDNLSTGSLFLTEYCVAVLNSKDILDSLEDVWHSLLEERNNILPRTINCITGPSRTGDIEQSIELGAHGPCHFHIIIVDSGG